MNFFASYNIEENSLKIVTVSLCDIGQLECKKHVTMQLFTAGIKNF